jgi:uncharacterized repeat protein (TIGR03803 family)
MAGGLTMNAARITFFTLRSSSPLIPIHASSERGTAMKITHTKFSAVVSKALAVTAATLIMALMLAPSASAAGKYKVLHRFAGGSDGSAPGAGVVFDSTGNLYTTTRLDGAYGNGAVVELTPNSDGGWTESVIYSFTGGTDGGAPYGTPIFDVVGNLYSTTSSGGVSGYGTVFMLTPDSDGSWTETTLHSFAGGTDGAQPTSGLIFDAVGNLYGETTKGGRGHCPEYSSAKGCGTVFELTPNSDGTWTESVLYAFAGGQDGGFPNWGNPVFDSAGNLYGTTRDHAHRGCAAGCGTLFELTPNSGGGWTEHVLHRFNQKDGGNADGTLIFDATGTLYGTTLTGNRYNVGAVFTLTLGSGGKWTERVIHAFTGHKDGGYPYSGVIFGAAGALYGTTNVGGNHGYGTVFELTPESGGAWKENVLHAFEGGKDGQQPCNDVVFGANGNLFDTTTGGSSGGTVFEITP